MNAGKLRQRITIQTRGTTQNAMGQPSSTWNDTLTVYARVVSVSGKEEFKGQQFNPEVTHQITIRSSTAAEAITPLQRISTNGRILDIISVNFGERRIDPIMITCKERVLDTGTAQ
jgi:SPP1 family predicted phage head-tail adaptor